MARATITVTWPKVSDAPGYDLFENGSKVSSTPNLSARFGVANGDKIEIRAQAAAPPPPPPSPSAVDAQTAWHHAPWNLDAQAAPLDPNSAQLAATMASRYCTTTVPYVNTNTWSYAWVYGRAGDPHYTVAQTKYPGPLDASIPIPAGAKPSPDGDGHLTIFDVEHGRVHDLWQAVWDGSKWSCSAGVSYPAGGAPAGNGSIAAGWPPLATGLWPEEIQAGQIDHALCFVVPHTRTGFRYPATHTGTGQGDAADLQEGTWVRLPGSLAPNTGWPGWAKTVFRALQDHGMFLCDQGGAALQIVGVNPVNGGVSWATVGMTSARFPADFPWAKTQILAAPTKS